MNHYEDRLLRAEGNVQDIQSGLAVNTAKLEHLSDKLDTAVELLGQKVDRTSECVDKMSTHLENNLNRVERLEDAEKRRSERYGLMFKIVTPAIIASGGWILHTLFHALLTGKP